MRTAMMKSLSQHSLPLAALAALLCAACEPMEPQTAYAFDRGASAPEQGPLTSVPLVYSPEGGYYVANVPANTSTIYILLNEDPSAQARPVAAAPAPPPPRVLPVAAPALPENPFAVSRVWRGKYVCTQGLTDLAFRVTEVNGPRIAAVFGFFHEDSGASGSYRMSGFFDARSGRVSFEPGEWIERPPNYVTVSMKGRITPDGSLFAGRIPHAGCSWFRLAPAR